MTRRSPSLTRRQRDVLGAIVRYIEREGFSPTIRELAEEIGVAGHFTVVEHLEQLEDKGFIARFHTRPRTIRVLRRDEGVA